MDLYRAVGPKGQTIDVMLSSKRDRHAEPPYAMTADKNPAYPIQLHLKP